MSERECSGWCWITGELEPSPKFSDGLHPYSWWTTLPEPTPWWVLLHRVDQAHRKLPHVEDQEPSTLLKVPKSCRKANM